MSEISKVMKMIKDKEVKFVDLRFTDTKGKWQLALAKASIPKFGDGDAKGGEIASSGKAFLESGTQSIMIPGALMKSNKDFTDVPPLITNMIEHFTAKNDGKEKKC